MPNIDSKKNKYSVLKIIALYQNKVCLNITTIIARVPEYLNDYEQI